MKFFPSLDAIIGIADRAYDDTHVVKAYHDDPEGEHGDTLAEFIARELRDVYSPTMDRDENLEAAAYAITRAISELRQVRDALEAAR